MALNILIIGGSYFIGRVFVETLLEDKTHHIYLINRGNRPIKRENVTEIVCDRHDTKLKQAIPQVEWDAVVDFCAYTPLDVIQLMLALSDHRVRHTIMISTTSIYEDTLDLPVKEGFPKLSAPQPHLGPASDYGYDKHQAEIRLADLCKKSNVPYTVLRPAIVYGKYNYAPRESYFFDLVLGGKTITLPKNKLALYQFVSVWDVARIVRSCIGNDHVFNHHFNLAAEELISYRRFVQVIQEITGKNVAIVAIDSKEIDEQGIPLPFPLENHLIFSGSQIKQVLGFEYMPFVEGMRKTYEWYRNEGQQDE